MMDTTLTFRLATQQDIDALEQFYNNINDYLAVTVNYTGWRKGIYPARQDAEAAIDEGALFIAEEQQELIGSLILRHTPEPAYRTASWQAKLDDRDVLVIYTFAVLPEKLGQGVGQRMLEFAESYAKQHRIQALRLDVYEGNFPAIHLYERCGFRHTGTVSLGLEELGLNRFRLYEKLL